VLERRLSADPEELAPRLDAIEIDARVETQRHWGRIHEFLVELLAHQGLDAVVAEELALLPGAEEVTTLLAVEELAASGRYDLVVVDCAPTDSTLRLVTLPEVAHGALRVLLPLFRAISGVATPLARRIISLPLPGKEVFRDAEELLYEQLGSLRQRITHPQTTVRMVVTPERMVIDEARRAWTELSLFEVSCDAVVMNRLLPDAAAGEHFFQDWGKLQRDRRREVEELFAPLPLLPAPLARDEVTGLEKLLEHGARIFAEVEPGAVLSRSPRVRYAREGEDYTAIVPLPGADPARLDVAKVDDELTITTGVRRRLLKLPRRMAPLELAATRLEGPSLVVRFVRPA
jgi:arsenite-transporting ATPase